MFSKNVLFLQILFFQSILVLKTHEYQYQVVSTTEEPSKLYKKPDQVLEVVNEIKSQLEEIRKEIVTLKEHNIQTHLQKEKEHLTILKNQFAEYKNWSENNIQIQWQKFEQNQNNYTKTYLENQFNEFKNWSKNNIQTEWQKFEQKQKDQQSLQNNFTETYLEKSHYNLQKLIGSMLQNQYRQHNNIVNEMKGQLETYMKNVDNKLAELTPPKSCTDVQKSGKTLSGIYTIWPDFSPKSFDVWCDMETRGGGWIYVMNRFDGSVDFSLNWTDYKNGFGDLNGEFWLGLEHLYILTKNKPNELLIELVHQNFRKAYAHYKEFSIGDEGEGYPMKTLKNYSGDAANYIIGHLGMKFSTADRDQDTSDDGNCAKEFGGGYWYTSCHFCLLTGIYNKGGIDCSTFRVKQIKMMVKY